MIEGRQGADTAHHHRHRVRVAAEALKKPAHLLVYHRVMNHAVVKIFLLCGGRQFTVEEQVAGLEEVAVLGQIFDRIAAVEQDALVAVDVGDLGFAACGRGKTGVVGENAGLAVKLADVHHLGTDSSLVERERPVLFAECQLARLGIGGAGLRIHERTSMCDSRNRAIHAALGLKKSLQQMLFRLRLRSATQWALQENRRRSTAALAYLTLN